MAQDGPNDFPRQHQRSTYRLALGVFKDPMFQLLIGAGALYLLLGDLAEALLLLAFVGVSFFISVIQETRAENALEKLRDLSSPRARVIRDGIQKRVSASELVLGDIVVLAEGDRVPADLKLLDDQGLMVDESILTGESLALLKSATGDPAQQKLYCATLVICGKAVSEVIATGVRTEFGKIGKSISQIPQGVSQLRRQTAQIVRVFGLIGIVLSLATWITLGLIQDQWLSGALSGITLAMALLPEEFGVVLTVFMAMGAWRIAKHQVLTRKNSAIEALGSATVLCVDKTGTLTENRMSLSALWSCGDLWQPLQAFNAKHFEHLLSCAVLASDSQAVDPIEKEIIHSGKALLPEFDRAHQDWVFSHEYLMAKNILAISRIWIQKDQSGFFIATKGAPESVIDLCHLSDEKAAPILKAYQDLGSRGMRVLAVACARFSGTSHPQSQHDFDFEFLGLIGFADPLRRGVPEAISRCLEAGIRVVMMTGDSPDTALCIAAQAGIVSDRNDHAALCTGAQLESMTENQIAHHVKSARVFARITPHQKLALVVALQKNGEIVGMTGDGVNDAPALTAADIGIAMGARGTDVARESSALVLLNDDFSSIVQTIEQGRLIYRNIRSALSYIVCIHVPIAGVAMLPLFFGAPMLLLPAHVAFLEIVVDPTSCFVFEAQKSESRLMSEPPRAQKEKILKTSQLAQSFAQGGLIFLACAVLYAYLMHQQTPVNQIRTLIFGLLMASGIAVVSLSLDRGAGRGERYGLGNRYFLAITGFTALILTGVIFQPQLRSLFQFALLPADLWGLGFMALLAVVLALKGVGMLFTHPHRHAKRSG